MDPWTIMTSGDFIGGITASYTNIMGGWFFALMLMTVVGAVYLKSQNVALTLLIMVLVGTGMAASISSQALTVIYVMTAIGGAIILAKIFGKL